MLHGKNNFNILNARSQLAKLHFLYSSHVYQTLYSKTKPFPLLFMLHSRYSSHQVLRSSDTKAYSMHVKSKFCGRERKYKEGKWKEFYNNRDLFKK
jgi:hypothetical protein